MTDSLMQDDQSLQGTNQQIDSYWDHLTGQGGKFHRPDEKEAREAVAKGKYDADRAIELVNRQKDEMRAEMMRMRGELDQTANMRELSDKIEAQLAKLASSDNTRANEDNQPKYDPKEVESLVLSKAQEVYTQNEVARQREQNFNLIKSKLRERHGDNFSDVLKTQMEVLGLSREDIDELARSKPALLMRTLGLDSQQQGERFQSPVRSNYMGGPGKPKEKTWTYYEDIRKKNFDLYYSPKIQAEMLQQHLKLGKDFEDGDFNLPM